MSNGERKTIQVQKIGAELPRSVQITTSDDREVYIPWGHVHEIHRETNTLVVSDWIARKENL